MIVVYQEIARLRGESRRRQTVPASGAMLTVTQRLGAGDGVSLRLDHFDPQQKKRGYPHPGCFRERVRICLKRKGMSFLCVKKSARKRDKQKNVGRAGCLKVGMLRGPSDTRQFP